MKSYAQLYFFILLFVAMKAPAQPKLMAPVKHPAPTSLPYQVPSVEQKIKHVTPVQIVPKTIAAREVKPQFSMHSASEQCSLLNEVHPSLKLEGERKGATLVNLQWEAKDLYHKKGFEVQRSFNDTNSFKTVAFVAGYTASSAREAYKLDDMNERIQPTYYRVKQSGPDTGYLYSNIILVKGIPQYSIFPNPVDDVLHLNIQSVYSCNVSIMVYDNKGVLLVKKSVSLTKDIINHKSINIHTLPAGIYTVQVVNMDTTLYTEKFIKQ